MSVLRRTPRSRDVPVPSAALGHRPEPAPVGLVRESAPQRGIQLRQGLGVIDGIPVMHLDGASAAARGHVERGRPDLARRAMFNLEDEAKARRFDEVAAAQASTYRDVVEALGEGRLKVKLSAVNQEGKVVAEVFTAVQPRAPNPPIRLTSDELHEAFISGLLATGCVVTSIGHASSPMLYFATCAYDFDGGVNITASHNPKNYNGAKFVGKNAHSICGDEIQAILKIIQDEDFAEGKGELFSKEIFS